MVNQYVCQSAGQSDSWLDSQPNCNISYFGRATQTNLALVCFIS